MVTTRPKLTGQDIDDLAALVRVLKDNPSLARTLADSATPLVSRADLVDQALAATGEVARTELKAGLDQSSTSGETLVQWLRDRLIANAWIWADQAGQLPQVVDQVFGFGQELSANRDLRWALVDRQADPAKRQDLVASVTASLLPASTALIQACVDAPDGTLDARLRRCVETGVDLTGARLATVTVAQPLDDDQRQRLSTALTERFGTPVILEEVVDPAVLGGVRVECGPDVVDATMTSRLEAARRAIA